MSPAEYPPLLIMVTLFFDNDLCTGYALGRVNSPQTTRVVTEAELTDLLPSWRDDASFLMLDGDGELATQQSLLDSALLERLADVDDWYQTTFIDVGLPYSFPPHGQCYVMASDVDIRNLQGMFLIAFAQISSGAPTTADWQPLTVRKGDGDYIDVIVSRQKVTEVGGAMFAFVANAFAAQRAHKEALRALTTVEDILNYEIS